MINKEILKFNDVVQTINKSGLIKINTNYEYMEYGKLYLSPSTYTLVDAANKTLADANVILNNNEEKLKRYYDLKLKDLYYDEMGKVLNELGVKYNESEYNTLFDSFTSMYYDVFKEDLLANLNIDFESSIIHTSGSAFKIKSTFTDASYSDVDRHSYLLEIVGDSPFSVLNDIIDINSLQVNQDSIISNFIKNINWYYNEYSDYTNFNSSWIIEYINTYFEELRDVLDYLSGDKLIRCINDDMHDALTIIDTIQAYKYDSVSFFKHYYVANHSD